MNLEVCYTTKEWISGKECYMGTDKKQAADPGKNNSQSGGNNQSAGEKKKKFVLDIRPYLAIGVTAVLVVVVCMAIFFLILRFGELVSAVGNVLGILQAIVFGCVLAYILNPVMRFFERNIQKLLRKKNKDEAKIKSTSRAMATAGAVLVLIVIIVVLLSLIIPEVITNVEALVVTLPGQINNMIDKIYAYTRTDGMFSDLAKELITNGSAYLEEWLKTNLLDQAQDWMTYVTSGVIGAVKLVFNFIIGIIVSVYILMRKETFLCQTKKLIYAIFKPKHGNVVMEVLRKSDEVFGGFFIGVIIDSIIIGLICFGVLYIIDMPYALLVSVIVGVTNVIPFFGPFLGAIPSAILILLVSPIHVVYFLIFIVILQQIDGNIIKPKILGNTTGLSPFWVIFAILLFGGVFGVAGMLFGVPVFAVIYYLIKRIAEHYLRKRKLPEHAVDYLELDYVDPDTGEPIYFEVDRETRHLHKNTEMGGTLLKKFMQGRKKKDKDQHGNE